MKGIVTILMMGALLGLQAQTLEDYQRIAAENNPGLLAEYKDFEAALQRVHQARGLPDPTLTASAFGQMLETRVGPQQARFSLSQMFPWFGTLKSRGEAAAYMAEANYQSYLDARNKLHYEVASAYYPLYELRELMRLEQENLKILESYKSIANSKFKYATGTLVDVLRVDIMLKEAAANLEILRKKEAPLRVSFNKLLNRDAKEPVVLADSLSWGALPSEALNDSLWASHPLLTALDQKVKAGEAAERVAVKQGLPELGIGLDYVIIGERDDLAPGSPAIPADNGKDAIMPMVSVSLPIFRGKYRAAAQEAQLMQQAYALQKLEVANSLASSYEMALFDLQQQKELLVLFTAQIQETEQALNLLFTAYGNAGNDFEEVLRMQQQLLVLGKQKIMALTQYRMAQARLDYIMAK